MSASLAEELALIVTTTGTASSTPLVTSYVSAAGFGRALLIAHLGDMAAETIDIAIYQATSSGGASAKSLKAATQLASSASANDSKQVVIGVDLNDLDVDGSFSFIAGRIVTGAGTGGTCTITVLGGDVRFAPATNVDNATVIQVVP